LHFSEETVLLIRVSDIALSSLVEKVKRSQGEKYPFHLGGVYMANRKGIKVSAKVHHELKFLSAEEGRPMELLADEILAKALGIQSAGKRPLSVEKVKKIG